MESSLKKVISFCLWGDDPKYCVGALKNAKLAAKIFPGWECWFYCRQDVDYDTLTILAMRDNCSVFFVDEPGGWRGMFDRFLPINDPEVSVVISRDCDSRLSTREKAAVDNWLLSGKGFHIMRDHPHHGTYILGGMFGIRHNVIPQFQEIMQDWLSRTEKNEWQVDQDFLRDEIYRRVYNDSVVHDEFFNIEPHRQRFPIDRQGLEFVGQVFNENDETVQEHLDALESYIK